MDHQWIINNYVSFQEVLSNTHTQSLKESDGPMPLTKSQKLILM